MKLDGNNLTISIGDSISFYHTCDSSKFDELGYIDIKELEDSLYITGVLIATIKTNHTELLVRSQFSHHTLNVSDIHQVNNLCIRHNNFIDSLKISIKDN